MRINSNLNNRIALQNSIPFTPDKKIENQISELKQKFKNAKRRLAIIDTRFPWKMSGFRYWENYQILNQLPDTLFFATDKYSDYFPSQVYPFSNFTRIAQEQAITDIYCVFLNLTMSILGQYQLDDGYLIPGYLPCTNIGTFIKNQGIRVHCTLYPGGGLSENTPNEYLYRASSSCTTIFTNAKEVLDVIPKSIYIPGVVNTEHYMYYPKMFDDSKKIQITFCAHNEQRKRFPVMVEAFNQLDNSFHLNLIGPWGTQLNKLTNPNFTYYGELDPEQLSPIYQKTHVFINCSTNDAAALDGFPTTTAVDAMSTGCILVTTNVRNDRYLLINGEDYLEITPDSSQSLLETLLWIRDNLSYALKIGVNGMKKVHENFDAKLIVRKKLRHMNLLS